jgi:hypothetical protein
VAGNAATGGALQSYGDRVQWRSDGTFNDKYWIDNKPAVVDVSGPTLVLRLGVVATTTFFYKVLIKLKLNSKIKVLLDYLTKNNQNHLHLIRLKLNNLNFNNFFSFLQ